MNQLINFIILCFVDWFDCIRSPLTTCRRILNSPLSDKEKKVFVLHTWIFAFLLSFPLEISIYYNFGIKIETSFLLSYFISGFLILFIYSFFMHIVLLIFRIKSSFYETLIIYTSLIGAYSPFILLLTWPSIFSNVLFIKTIRDEHIDLINNIYLLKDIIIKIQKQSSIAIISSFTSMLGMILASIIGVLFSYAIVERYHSNKFRTLLSLAFFNMILIPHIATALIKDIIIYMYLAK